MWLPILLAVSRTGNMNFPRPRSRPIIWSSETGSAVLSRVSPPILHTQAESDWLMVLTYGLLSSDWLMMLTYGLLSFLPFSAAAFIYTVNHRRVWAKFTGHASAYQ